MCGYCTETAVFTDIIAGIEGGRLGTHDRSLYSTHLQEASDWRGELQSWDLDDDGAGAFVALCRIWSERLAGSVGTPLSGVLSVSVVEGLESWLKTLTYPPEWQWVLTVDGYPPGELPIEMARASLGSYIHGWLQQANPDVGWDHKTLYERFLGVLVALDILATHAPGDELLQVLATREPRLTPVLNGLDLWLQRRALHACVAHSGVRFIDEHWEELRVEAILSIVIGNLLSNRELTVLHAALQDRSHKPGDLGLPELLQAIQSRLKRTPSAS
jgi:hypothetical protein